MGDVVRFDEAAARVRSKRETGRIAGSDLFWIAAVCCWPVSLALFAGQAALEAFGAFIAGGSSGSRS